MAFIKSHSNYTLKKKHQNISDGTIWERDITTIGGVNQFAPGQTPIYKSSNFIITVRNDDKIANQYNQTKWKENESGNTWTLENISGMTSEFEDQNDVKIVLKQDYYDFCDFAYYGSLSEMFRSSINDVLQRFPGELYITDISGNTYTSGITEDFEEVKWSEILGDSNYTLVSNPFGIDIHSKRCPIDGNALKYFADDGHKNYQIVSGDSVKDISTWNSEIINSGCTRIGEEFAIVTINRNIIIHAYVGDNREIVYLAERGNAGIHIRPKEESIVKFYNECDNFEKLILDRKTTPRYKAVFSVIKENERGYYRETEDFIFPTTYGDYNIDASSYGFNDYTQRLSEIGEFYDALFTDNLYRSMTHEAIKNFDWTYTREFTVGDEEEYVHGGEKMQKALRIFAREFDEILTYINNIKNINRVTYDERNNIPDYFLIDETENKGWDVCLVYPYDLEEYIKNDNGTKEYVSASTYDDEQQQLDNTHKEKHLFRQFTQNARKEVRPYSKEWVDGYKYGYFVACESGDVPCWYESNKDSAVTYNYIDAENSGTTYYDRSHDRVVNRVKVYTDEKSYTYMDANNAFMRRMAINSPYIWRHKGTIEGIEMLLGMFGLKSQRWVDRMTPNCVNSAITADYEITEYSSFTDRIEEEWDAVHQMYRIDWINSTKAIVYDYRSASNYTKYGAPSNYVSYQGLPVSYRYEYLSADKPYIEVSPLSAQSATSSVTEAFKDIKNNNEPVRRRYLYPNFNKDEQLDGNPYFQMNGGWVSKTVQNGSDNRYNFQYDVDDNITYTCYVASGETTESGDVIDNHPIYKETVRNIKRVDTIGDLLSTPINTIKDGSIIYVSNVERDVAIIDNEVYNIKHEYSGTSDSGKVLSYVSLIKNGDYIKIGDSKFFMSTIVVYDKNGKEVTYNLEDKESGYEVKAYIKETKIDDKKAYDFICKANTDGTYTIDRFMILDGNVTTATTNYFIIDDSYYSNRLAANENENGWRRLEETDPEYIRINAITNYYEGNNPHNGNMNYDNGHEYFTYFKRLFKYPIDNDLFDERCYEAFYYDLDTEISNYGFSGLVDSNEMIKQYNPYLISGDSKIHYFGSYYKKSSSTVTPCENVLFYGEDKEKKEALEEMYHKVNSGITVESYILNEDDIMIGGSPYSAKTNADEVTNQILNNKRFTIKFYLHNEWHSNQGQCEIKYLDSIVMNYLTQMIPSTTIVDIQYVYDKVD